MSEDITEDPKGQGRGKQGNQRGNKQRKKVGRGGNNNQNQQDGGKNQQNQNQQDGGKNKQQNQNQQDGGKDNQPNQNLDDGPKGGRGKKNNKQNQQDGGKNNQQNQNNQQEGGKNKQQNQNNQQDGGKNKQQNQNQQEGGKNNLEGGDVKTRKRIRNKRTPSTLNTKSTQITLQMDDPQKRKQVARQQVVALVPITKKVELFSHLPSYKRSPSISQAIRTDDVIHPAILRLGFKFAERIITGANARCLAMLMAFQSVIEDYTVPPDTNFTIDIDSKFKVLIQYLIDCRPLSIGMGNAVKSFKKSIGGTRKMNDKEAKEFLLVELKKIYKK